MINQRDKNYNFPDFKDSTILEAPSKIICPQYHHNRGMKKLIIFLISKIPLFMKPRPKLFVHNQDRGMNRWVRCLMILSIMMYPLYTLLCYHTNDHIDKDLLTYSYQCQLF